jgi:hypothetical protein
LIMRVENKTSEHSEDSEHFSRDTHETDLDLAVLRLSKLRPSEYGKVRDNEAQRLAVDPIALDERVVKRRRKFLDKIRKLLARTVESGCSQHEADQAAIMAAEYKSTYNVDETELADSATFEDGLPDTTAADLLKALISVFERHLGLPPGAALVAPLWSIHAHALECFHISPFLIAISPLPNCGKSRVLEILSLLTPNAKFSPDFSRAAFSYHEGDPIPTFLIDEAEHSLNSKSIVSTLRSSYRRSSARVERKRPGKTARLQDQVLLTWAPKAFTWMGPLDSAVESRSILIRMTRMSPEDRDRVPDFNPENPSTVELLGGLNLEIAIWVRENFDRLKQSNPKMPPELYGRYRDNWKPIFAIADLIGDDFPELVREAALSIQFAFEAEEPEHQRLLRGLKTVRDAVPNQKEASPDELVKGAWDLPESEWRDSLTANKMSRLLKRFLISTHSGCGPKKNLCRYFWADFEPHFKAYL